MEKANQSSQKGKLKKSRAAPKPVLAAEEDERFSKIYQNPVYRRVPKNKKRIDIDSRFGAMFHDDKFKLKYKVDKRGKPINVATDEDMKRYYNLIEDSASDEDEPTTVAAETLKLEAEVKEEIESENEVDDTLKAQEVNDGTDLVKEEVTFDEQEIKEEASSEGEEEVKLSEKTKKKLQDLTVDYARGEALLNSDSDSESEDSSSDTDAESSTNEDEELPDMSHAWGELDRDAPRTDEITSRLALCNMDWDRIKSEDLMILFSSFLPAGGVLKHVAIYTSEFGKKRLAEEDLYGPQELRENLNNGGNSSVPNNDSDDDYNSEEEGDNEEGSLLNPAAEEDEEGSGFHMERLRKYQLNRLKYYYAVMEFDSDETANKIYTECDGLEFESSAARIDLRFIPDDTVFDDEPRDKCDTLPSPDKYIPKFFTTTALQQLKVDLTWDETDPQRQQLFSQRIYNPKENVDDEDIRAYLASSASEDESEGDKIIGAEGDSDDDDEASSKDPISKYRGLLESIQENEKKKKDKEVEMEITWGVGIRKTTEGLVKKKLDEQKSKKMTPWEEILAKKVEKKKERKKLGKTEETAAEEEQVDAEESSGSEDADEDQPFSDDDVDVDLNDPFFKDELGPKADKKSKQKLQAKKNAKEESGSNAAKEKAENAAALELLLMDDNADEKQKSHFSLKKIIEDESETKSKKKRKRNKKKRKGEEEPKTTEQDNFQIDLSDNRFNALYTSHKFNIDPSDPNYKSTKSMGAIISEKQKRRQQAPQAETIEAAASENGIAENEQPEAPNNEVPAKKSKSSIEIASLMKSIKRNTENMKSKNNKFSKLVTKHKK